MSLGAHLWFTGGTSANPYTWKAGTKITGSGYTVVASTVAIPSGVDVPASSL